MPGARPMARRFEWGTRAPWIGALVALCLGTAQAADLPDSCGGPQGRTSQGQVDHVYDGDTVRLTNGTRVRLIGLDTPEIFWREQTAEPYGHEARDALVELLREHDNQVLLVHDAERKDRYQRTLAHLFTPDGQPITALMLRQGLATALTIPPNDWHVECYRDTEALARGEALRIWSLEHLEAFEAEELPRDAEGFRIVTGEVVRIGLSQRAHWINLEGNVAFRIDREDMQYFPDLDIDALRGEQVEGRGFVYTHRGQPRIRIRHPVDLRILD